LLKEPGAGASGSFFAEARIPGAGGNGEVVAQRLERGQPKSQSDRGSAIWGKWHIFLVSRTELPLLGEKGESWGWKKRNNASCVRKIFRRGQIGKITDPLSAWGTNTSMTLMNDCKEDPYG
jgi:hypothetical protein